MYIFPAPIINNFLKKIFRNVNINVSNFNYVSSELNIRKANV